MASSHRAAAGTASCSGVARSNLLSCISTSGVSGLSWRLVRAGGTSNTRHDEAGSHKL